MIIDRILDRKDGEDYSPRAFYADMMEYGEYVTAGHEIARAMDEGSEADVKRVICAYIDDEGYNPEIKDFVNSVEWLTA